MSKPSAIDYENASDAVKAVFDDIKTSRNVPDVNNFWKYIANDERTLRRTWESLKEVMAPGALDPLVKELVYIAVSITNNCGYCIASHSAAASAIPVPPRARPVPARARSSLKIRMPRLLLLGSRRRATLTCTPRPLTSPWSRIRAAGAFCRPSRQGGTAGQGALAHVDVSKDRDTRGQTEKACWVSERSRGRSSERRTTAR